MFQNASCVLISKNLDMLKMVSKTIFFHIYESNITIRTTTIITIKLVTVKTVHLRFFFTINFIINLSMNENLHVKYWSKKNASINYKLLTNLRDVWINNYNKRLDARKDPTSRQQNDFEKRVVTKQTGYCTLRYVARRYAVMAETKCIHLQAYTSALSNNLGSPHKGVFFFSLFQLLKNQCHTYVRILA